MEPAHSGTRSPYIAPDELKENFNEEVQGKVISEQMAPEMKELLMTYQSSLEATEAAKQSKLKRLAELRREEAAKREIYNQKLATLERYKQTLQGIHNHMAETEINYNAQLTRKKEILQVLKDKNQVNSNSNSELTAVLMVCEAEHESAKSRKQELKTQLAQMQIEQEEKQQKLADFRLIRECYTAFVEKSDTNLLELQQTLKAAHNYYQELQGNIRVFCRIRPVIHSDLGAMSAFQLSENSISLVKQSQLHSFKFDKVFGPGTSQAEIFEEVSQLVRSAVDGYKVCIFAYGQTGSGKTFTMEGPGGEEVSSEDKGIIQRSVEQIFSSFESQAQLGWTYTAEISCIEVYNETVQDLLEGSKKITAFSTNMLAPTTVQVIDPAQLYPILKKARQQRAAAQTMCNERSSRSHSLFTLKLTGYHAQSHTETSGALNLIDLAGSERLYMSQVEGERLEETKAINKSLSSLSDVIQAIAKKEKYIPFRNSKLTHLLQSHLGSESKTLMFVNISPLEQNLQESLSSLRFASKVNICQLGKAQRQTRIVTR